jgi:hypothetical protein
VIVSLPSSREAQLGPAGEHENMRSCVVVASNGSLMTWGAMGDAGVSKDRRIQAHTVSVIC